MDYKTGDILLFCGKRKYDSWLSYFSSFVTFTTSSFVTHIGIILKDPRFLDTTLKGTYVWESSWEGSPDPQDGEIKLGVQITPLDEIIEKSNKVKQTLLIRKVNCEENAFSYDKLKKIHDVVYDRPYDICPRDWFDALFRKDKEPQKTDRFWCSALVGYIYTKCGILKEKTDWSILRPSDFSLESENLDFTDNCSLENSEFKIN